MEIQSIVIPQTSTQTVPNIYTPNWLQSEPVVPFPLVPVTQQVGVPVIPVSYTHLTLPTKA